MTDPNADVYISMVEQVLGPYVTLVLRARVEALVQDGTPGEVHQQVKEFTNTVLTWADSVAKGDVPCA